MTDNNSKLIQPANSNLKELESNEFSEKKMKTILEFYLISHGWFPVINWGENHGVDIEAELGNRKWIIEVKAERSPIPAPNISFILVLGEILQRMDDSTKKYSIALPDSVALYRLWKRMPLLAKNRMGITALFVNPSGSVREDFI
jgi:hypothetical protein